MKRIEAIIRPSKVADVCSALAEAGHTGLTISTVEGRGRERGWTHHVRNMIFQEDVLSRARVEVVVNDNEAPAIVKTIREAALTGAVGDGMIFLHDIAEAVRIRTNECGAAAL